MATDPRPDALADLLDLLARQRAHRRFEDRPVDDELVQQCLEAATRAPSAENLQPWELVVVRDAERRAAIGALTRDAWRGGGRAHSEGRLAQELLDDVDQGAEGGIASAPVLVVVCGNSERALRTTLSSSIFPAVQNLLLAATAAGLGSALTTLTLLRIDELRALLDLPEHVLPMALVPLGWPARRLGPSRRDPVGTRAHRERFGTPW